MKRDTDSWELEISSSTNPFPGLRPFRTDEHHLFFGREEQTAALLSLLREHRFLAVVGTSGSGKSSLVRAGLIPALHRGSMARVGSSWEVVVLRPGGNPVTQLARALVECDLYDARDLEAVPRLRATLSRSIFGLVEAVRQSDALDPGTSLLVVVDQFEELFRFRQRDASSEETATAFVNLLLAASVDTERRIFVVVTMRSDYLGDCAQIPGLAEAVNRGEYLIPRLSRDQRRDAIEKPVGVGEAKIAPRLVQLMLNDLGDDPDQLPVLQHALMRTWDAWVADHAEGEPIDLRHYEATGGMAAALSRHADQVFQALPDDHHRQVAERIFRTLTVKGADNRGIRRPTRLGRLARIVGGTEPVVATVVDAYRRPGVTFLMPGPRTELAADTVVDLSHESLMRVWRRLSSWVDQEAQSARVYRRLAETAALWDRGEAGLYHDPDLQIARSWRDEEDPNADWAEQYGGGYELALSFLDRSREAAEAGARAREEARRRELAQAKAVAEAEHRRLAAERRAKKRLKVFAAGLGVVAAIAVAAFLVAIEARKEAVSNAKLAESNAELARSKELIATKAAEDASRSAAELKRTLVASDFVQGVERIEAGDVADGLSSLARALRTDDRFRPAGMRALSTLASGRFPLTTFDPIRQDRVITTYRLNEKEDLLFTSAAADDRAPERIVWDLRTGRQLHAVAPGKKLTSDVRWTDGGDRLVAYVIEDKAIRSWEARSGEEAGPPIAAENLAAFRIAEHGELGTVIVGKYEDHALQVWRLDSGEAVTSRLTSDAPASRGFGAAPDGRHVYGACSDGTIAFWDVPGGSAAGRISTRPHAARQNEGLRFAPDGATFVCLDQDEKRVSWWRLGAPDAGGSWLEFEDPVEPWFLPRGRGQEGVAKLAILSRGGPQRPFRIEVRDLATRARTALVELPRPQQTFLPADEEPSTLLFPVIGGLEANVFRVWDLETGSLLRETFTPALQRYAGFSPEGRRVYTVSIANEVMLWDLFSGAPLLARPLQHEGSVALAFSPDGEKLVTHDAARGLVQLWDSRTGERLAEPVEQRFVSAIFFPSQAHRLLLWESITTTSGSFRKQTDGSFRLLDIASRPALAEPFLDGTAGASASALFTPDGRSVVIHGKQSAGDPWQLMIWDAASRSLRRTVPLPPNVYGYADAFRLSQDGRSALLGSSDGRARAWSIETGDLFREIVAGDAVTALAASPDAARVATGTSRGRVRVWDLATGAPLHDAMDHGDSAIRNLDFSPDGRLLASSSMDFKVRLVEASTGRPLFDPIATDNIVNVSLFSRDGAHLAVTPFSSEVLIVETATGKIERRLRHNDACRVARFSPDGRILAVGVGGQISLPVGSIHLWDWRSGREIGRPLDAQGPVEHLEFSADGSAVVSGTLLEGRGTVRVWDVESGMPLTEPVVARVGVSSVGFRPGADEVVACWRDGGVRALDLPPRSGPQPAWLSELAEAIAGRRRVPGLGGVESVGADAIAEVRRKVDAASTAAEGTEASPQARWALWLLSTPEERTVSPGSPMAFREYLARLRRSERVEDLEEAIRLEPSDALAHVRLGLVLLSGLPDVPDLSDDLRRLWRETAERYSLRAVELSPGDAEVWAIRAEVLQRLGRTVEASSAVARAVEIDPSRAGEGSANAPYLRAVALAGEGTWEDADAAFREALRRVSASARGGDRSAAAPLLGILAALEPTRAPSGFRDLRLPPPIPGTFEAFESVAEGGLPEGWTGRHEPGLDAGPGAGPLSGRLDATESDAFLDWVVLSSERAADAGDLGERLLRPASASRVDGESPAPLLDGRFLCAVSSDRGLGRAQRVTTPELDCSGRAGVHVAFHSAYEQGDGMMGAVEYSVDGGTTWLPVAALIDAADIAYDAAGTIDIASTLGAKRGDAAVFLDERGALCGGSYGAFLRIPAGDPPGPAILGSRVGDASASKRVELFRLPAADGRPKVRLRFTLVGKGNVAWGIDDVGLYEIPEGGEAKGTDVVDVTEDPRLLAGIGWEVLLRGEPIRRALEPRDLRRVTPAEPKAGQPAGPTGPGDARVRRIHDARLLLRRAAAIAPHDPWISLASAVASARDGDPAEALRAARGFSASEPLDRFSASALAAVQVARADALKEGGDGIAAGVLYELGQVLHGIRESPDPALIERLTEAGLIAKSEVLLPRGTEWSYLDRGGEPDPSWTDPAFDDGSWLRGKARLGYGGDGEVTVTSFGPDPQKKRIATYFRAAFEVGDPARFAQAKIRIQRDDGAIVHLNGEEVLRDNMPDGPVGAGTTARGIVGDADEARFFEHDVPSSKLRPGRNVIAVEVHQQSGTSSDLGFDLELEGTGGLEAASADSAELVAIEERLEVPADQRALLWISRARRFRETGDLDRAWEAIERASRLVPESPSVAYERSAVLFARGDEPAARAAYLEAAERAIALKAGARDHEVVILPPALRSALEPIVRPTGTSVAAAAERVARSDQALSRAAASWLIRWSEALDSESWAARRQRADALLALRRPAEALAIADAALAAGSPDAAAPPRRIREHRDWLRIRESCLRALERTAEADAVRDEIFGTPPRRPGQSPRLIDLSAHYNGSLHDGRGWFAGDDALCMRLLPETFVPRDGLEFDVRGVIQLDSGVYAGSGETVIRDRTFGEAMKRRFPTEVLGIPVGLEAKALHLLLGSNYGRETTGVEVARLAIHYEDGSEADMPLRFGTDIVDWYYLGAPTLDPARVAWRDYVLNRGVVRATWTNPHPEKTIRAFDFVSTRKKAAPFLVAVTAE